MNKEEKLEALEEIKEDSKVLEFIAITMQERDKLQSNWNSLKDFFEKGKKEPNYIKGDMFWNEFCEISLDKMNELEGVDDEQ